MYKVVVMRVEPTIIDQRSLPTGRMSLVRICFITTTGLQGFQLFTMEFNNIGRTRLLAYYNSIIGINVL